MEGWGDTPHWQQQSREAAGRLRQGTAGCFLILKGGVLGGGDFSSCVGLGGRSKGQEK